MATCFPVTPVGGSPCDAALLSHRPPLTSGRPPPFLAIHPAAAFKRSSRPFGRGVTQQSCRDAHLCDARKEAATHFTWSSAFEGRRAWGLCCRFARGGVPVRARNGGAGPSARTEASARSCGKSSVDARRKWKPMGRSAASTEPPRPPARRCRGFCIPESDPRASESHDESPAGCEAASDEYFVRKLKPLQR